MAELGPIARFVGRSTKRIVVSTVGFALLAIGIVLLVVPGPGLLLVAAGLAVLATEYAWARSALEATRRRTKQLRDKMRQGPQPS